MELFCKDTGLTHYSGLRNFELALFFCLSTAPYRIIEYVGGILHPEPDRLYTYWADVTPEFFTFTMWAYQMRKRAVDDQYLD
ncbi:MAG: hypothetical protein RR728_08550 [Oscillospiraceae bacterium]